MAPLKALNPERPSFPPAAAWALALAVVLLASTDAARAAAPANPANPRAGAKARAVLAFFHELDARTEGRRIVSGQFSDFGNGANLALFERIHEKTGHWPAMIGVDYADFGRGGLTFRTPNAVATAYARQGGLVTVSAHLYNPANPKGGGLRDTGVELDDLLTPGNETHVRWMEELNQLAGGLEELKDAGVVVLWRPFHEMNGGWFWWGAHEPAKFIRLWRHMFEYFSTVRGLDNLLWVYGPNHGPNTAKYYAGDAYVDLVGLDAYTDFVDPAHIKGYAEVAALPKPFGFSEFGPHGPQRPPGDYDYRRFLEGLKTHFPRSRYFKCWNAKWSLASNQFTRELLDDPAILNRADLPPGLGAEPVTTGMTAIVDPVSGQVDLREDGRPVLRYNFRTVEPGEIANQVTEANRIYTRARSDYIHPLYDRRGVALTRDWPADHPHHRGIYWAWPEVEFGGARGDLHALQRVFARPEGEPRVRSGPGFAEVEADHLWRWEDRLPIVRERVVIRAERAAAGGRVVDLDFQFVGLEPGVSVARRDTLHYGGLNLRLATPTDQVITTHTEGPEAVPRRAWSDLSGVFRDGTASGLTVLQHRENPGYPGDWVQYPELSWCQPAFPSAGTRHPLPPGEPLRLRFRLWIHDGPTPSTETLAALWDAYHAALPRPARPTEVR